MFLEVDDSTFSVHRDQLKSAFSHAESFIDLMFSFSSRFNAFNLVQGEVALFSALMLISPGEFLEYMQYSLARQHSSNTRASLVLEESSLLNSGRIISLDFRPPWVEGPGTGE